MKFIYGSIFLIILLNGCNSYTNDIKEKESGVIKYYTKALEYNNNWSKYNMGHIFIGKPLDNINFKDAVARCQGAYDSITKVFYKNKDFFIKNIPYKSVSYCFNPSKGTVRHYDNEGKVTEIIYSDKIIKYIYTPTEKIEKTFNRKTNDIFTEKSIYDKNMKLIKILKFKNGKQYSTYLFDKKNKNILREYDIKGKHTGEFLVIDEFLNN